METSVLRNLVKRVPSNHRNCCYYNNLDYNATADQKDIAVHNLLGNGSSSHYNDGTNNRRLSLELLSLEGDDLNHVETTIFGSSSSSSNNNNNSRRSSLTSLGGGEGPERQPSVGTFLATLPEDSLFGGGGGGSSSHIDMSSSMMMNESGVINMDEFDLNNNNSSFMNLGEESFLDLGVSEEEARALQKLSRISSAMACIEDLGDDDDDIFDFEDDEDENEGQEDDELDIVQEEGDEGDASEGSNPDVLRADDSFVPTTAVEGCANKPSLERTVEGSMNMNDLLVQHKNSNNNNKSSSVEISLNGHHDFNFEEQSSRSLYPSITGVLGGGGGLSDNNNNKGSSSKMAPRPSFSRSLAKRTVVPDITVTTANANAGANAPQEPATTTTSRSTANTRTPSSKSLKSKAKAEKPGMIRRNTCGTLYVGSTMSAPDKDATIKVCRHSLRYFSRNESRFQNLTHISCATSFIFFLK
jgi:hypothetical protein